MHSKPPLAFALQKAHSFSFFHCSLPVQHRRTTLPWIVSPNAEVQCRQYCLQNKLLPKKTCRLLQEANQPVSSAQHKTKAKSSIRINISASGTALCTTWLQLWLRYDYSKPKDGVSAVSGYSKSGPNTNRRNGEVLLQSSRFTRTCLQVNLAPLLRKGRNGKKQWSKNIQSTTWLNADFIHLTWVCVSPPAWLPCSQGWRLRWPWCFHVGASRSHKAHSWLLDPKFQLRDTNRTTLARLPSISST